MSQNSEVNPKIVSSIQAIQQATMTSTMIKHSGAGKAYQSVSQTTAIAIQDAADNLRNISTMGATAMGVAMAEMLAKGKVEPYKDIIQEATKMIEDSANNFKTIGTNAEDVLKSFPVGD